MSFWTSPNIHPKTKSRFIVSFGTRFFLPNVKSVTKPAVEIATKEYRLMNHYFNYPGLVRWQPIQITFVDMNGDGGQFDTSQMLYEMLNNSGYAPPTEKNHPIGKTPQSNAAPSPVTTPEKASTIANSFGDGLWSKTNYSPESPNYNNRTIRIQQINSGEQRKTIGGEQISLGGFGGQLADQGGPNARVIEQWELVNPIITNISWGDLDYGSDELVECTLSIIYDWAEYSKTTENASEPLITDKYSKFSN